MDEKDKELSDKNEIQLMKRLKSKIITVITTIVVTFSILGFVVGVYGNVIFQEGDPVPLITSIAKLEFTDTDFVLYAQGPDQYVSEFESGSDRYKVVKDFMQEKRWAFKEQMGSGLIFEKDGDKIVIEIVWSIPEIETKLN